MKFGENKGEDQERKGENKRKTGNTLEKDEHWDTNSNGGLPLQVWVKNTHTFNSHAGVCCLTFYVLDINDKK